MMHQGLIIRYPLVAHSLYSTTCECDNVLTFDFSAPLDCGE